MQRLFIREKTEEKFVSAIEKQKIGVAGMSRGAGATFIATSLAKILSYRDDRKVTFLEVCDLTGNKSSLTYDSIGIDKRFKTREFVRFYNEIKSGGSIRGKTNPDDRINWGLITPEDVKAGAGLITPEDVKAGAGLTPIEMIRLINNISGDLIICDISECRNAEDYLLDMDYVIFVIDPVPSAMIKGYPFMREVKRIEYRGKKVIWVINKYNSGINKRDMQSFLKLKEYYRIPLMDAGHFYSAEYNCKIPFEVATIQDGVRETMEKIIKELVLC